MQKNTRNTLILQLFIALIVAAYWSTQADFMTAVAGLFGGLMVVVNTLWQMRSMHQAEKVADDDVQANMGLLYRYAMQRFVITLALFALGMKFLDMDPLALLSGFIAGQLSLLFGGNKN
jgi:hypothetical protein